MIEGRSTAEPRYACSEEARHDELLDAFISLENKNKSKSSSRVRTWNEDDYEAAGQSQGRGDRRR